MMVLRKIANWFSNQDGGFSKHEHQPRQGHDLRIGWVISNDRAWASSRLQGYLIHEWLLSHGYASQILLENFNVTPSVRSWQFFRSALQLSRSGCDIIVFENGEWVTAQLARVWRRLGKRAVGVRCDRVPGAFDETYDLTIVPTEELRQALNIQRAIVIEDCVEVREEQFKHSYAKASSLRVVWLGHQDYESYITGLIATLGANREISGQFEFELISKGAFATRQWSEGTVAADILDCDIALIAIPQGPWFQTKSTNRLALMMALGMPTVATLIPSYSRLAKEGENVLFVSSDEEIADCLLKLKNESLREALGTNARQSVLGQFGINRIAPQWLGALETTMRSERAPLPKKIHWMIFAKMLYLVNFWRLRNDVR
ncbi:glycosyltransferase [Undibacterium sp.]|jgi:hypothetical protein|uniref:glycosyltransferase n=1 Tax=Undibacterium sp. TaxID=1914977 RepID=UPI002B9F3BBE|nr:glycosyltransferase [Undibacterium sp.]HTD05646.1 glycosyltransferase [Undibacterium sp.]